MIASITGKSYDIPPAIDQITALINKKPKVFNGTKIGTTDGNAAGNQNSDRGFIRNQWLKDEHLEAYPEIAGLLNGLDADSWVYYTNTNYGAGLYWTTEDLQSLTFSKGNKDASSEYLLSYYYDPNAADGKNFKVIQNRVWTGQKDMAPVGSQTSAAQATNMTALAGLNKEHEKSVGQVVWSGTSYAEAQKAYNEYKLNNNNSAVFTSLSPLN